MVEIKKALAIQCWDVFVNGVFMDRFDRKYEAKGYADRLKKMLGV